jgi:hypothetical protein
MWVCGCCNSKFLQFPLEEIRAREGTCFVGDTFFLLHKENLHEDAVEMGGVSSKDSYGKVRGRKEIEKQMYREDKGRAHLCFLLVFSLARYRVNDATPF